MECGSSIANTNHYWDTIGAVNLFEEKVTFPQFLFFGGGRVANSLTVGQIDKSKNFRLGSKITSQSDYFKEKCFFIFSQLATKDADLGKALP